MNWRLSLVIIAGVCLPLAAQAQSTYIIPTVVRGVTSYRAVSSAGLKKLPAATRRRAQPNRTYHALYTPNDPEFSYQWDLQLTNLPGAWDATTTPPFFGDPRVVVAVLDTGVAYAAGDGTIESPDLLNLHLWTNPDEIGGDGIDNDHDGFVDDVHGWNFLNNTGVALDNHGHGTHIASIIAADTNNTYAAAGIAPNVTIMPLKVLDQHGDGTTLTIAQAIDFAVAHGANIINLSLGGSDPDDILHTAILNASAHGVLVVAASGNEGVSSLNYPARYTETISVGATQYDNSRAPYSNYGPELSLVAPGGNISVDQNNDGQKDGILQETCAIDAYGHGDCSQMGPYLYTGTSQAAAHVSGVLALMASCELSQGNTVAGSSVAIRDALLATATDIGALGRDNVDGNGLINAQAALSAVGCTSNNPEAPGNLTVTSRVGGATLSSTRLYPYTKPLFTWTGPAGATYQLKWGLSGHTPTVTTQSTTTFQPTVSKNGTYLLEVTALDANQKASSPVVMMYRYRSSQILVSTSSSLNVLSAKGTNVKTIAVTAGGKTPLVTGGVVTASSEDRYLVSGVGQITFFKTTGTKSTTIKPFGSLSQLLDTAIINLANQAPTLSVAKAQGSEFRVTTVSGTLLKRVTLGNGKLTGLRTAAGDIDGDGTDEIVAVDVAGSAIRLFHADGTPIMTLTPAGKSYRGGWAVAMGDINGDGRAEILAIRADSRKSAEILVINATGKVIKKMKLTGLKSTGALQIAAADVDGNGKDEIIVYAPGKAELTVWTERGTRQKVIQLSGAAAATRQIGRLQ